MEADNSESGISALYLAEWALCLLDLNQFAHTSHHFRSTFMQSWGSLRVALCRHCPALRLCGFFSLIAVSCRTKCCVKLILYCGHYCSLIKFQSLELTVNSILIFFLCPTWQCWLHMPLTWLCLSFLMPLLLLVFFFAVMNFTFFKRLKGFMGGKAQLQEKGSALNGQISDNFPWKPKGKRPKSC